MRLSFLYETAVTTSAIAAGPMVALGAKGKRRKGKKTYFGEKVRTLQEGYMGVGETDQPKNDKTLVWQPLKSKKPKKASWEQKYAATNDPDERLLKQYRGKGY